MILVVDELEFRNLKIRPDQENGMFLIGADTFDQIFELGTLFGLKQLDTRNGEEVLLDQAGGFFGPCHVDKLIIVIIFLIGA